MNKKILLAALFFLLSLNSPARAEDNAATSSGIISQKSYKQYLTFRSKILELRGQSRTTLIEIKNLGHIEKWPGDQMRQETKELELISKLLLGYNKSFVSYNNEEFIADIIEIEQIAQRISEIQETTKIRVARHQEIRDKIQLSRDEYKKAYEATYQLYVIRKNIEFFYKQKYPDSAMTPLETIENRLRTKQLLEDLAIMQNEITKLEQAETAGFSGNNVTYNPEEILQKLQKLAASFTDVKNQSLENIKEDSITLKAFSYLPAN